MPGKTRGRKSLVCRIAESKLLDNFILLVIIFNCVLMTFPPSMTTSTDKGNFFVITDLCLNVIFLAEFLIKFTAYGFAYFKDPWNSCLDFPVVLQGSLAILEYAGSNKVPFGDISALRMLRVLRPLKSLRKFPEMRLLVSSLFGSFNLLLAIMVLTGMVVFCFAAFAMLFFGDALDYRCIPDPYYDPFLGEFMANPYYFNATSKSEVVQEEQSSYWQTSSLFSQYTSDLATSSGGRRSREQWLTTNFYISLSQYKEYAKDLIAQAETFPYIGSFCGECATCHKCERCYSDDPADGCNKNVHTDFFRRYGDPEAIKANFLGAEPSTRELEGMGVPVPYNHSSGVHTDAFNLLNASDYPNVDPGTSTGIVREYCVDLKKARSYYPTVEANGTVGRVYTSIMANGLFLTRWGRKLPKEDLTEDIWDEHYIRKCEEKDPDNPKRKKKCLKESLKLGERKGGFYGHEVPRVKHFQWYLTYDRMVWSLLTIFDAMNMENWNDSMWATQMAVGKYTWPFFYAVVGIINICFVNLFPAVMSFNLRKAIREEENKIATEAKRQFMGEEMQTMTQFEEHMIDILAAEEEDMIAVSNYVRQTGRGGGGGKGVSATEAIAQDYLDRMPGVPRNKFADSLRQIVRPELGRFACFIYLCILANVAVMAQKQLHYSHGQAKKYEHVLNELGDVFTYVFMVEALIKIAALGFAGYFYDVYNRFDFSLVAISVLRLALEELSQKASILSLLRVIRAFRIIRVIRLGSLSKVHRTKTMTSSQLNFSRLMGIMASSSVWVMNVLGLLFLALYMASIVSMQFFGGEVYTLNDYSGQWKEKGRLNFDSFPMAIMTNFIVVSTDDWNTIMYNTMDKCGALAAVYFVLLFAVGRYAILSLLTAVIFDQVERDSIMVLKLAAQTTMVAVYKFEHALTKGLLRLFFSKWCLASRSQFESVEGAAQGTAKAGAITMEPPPDPPKTLKQRFFENDRSYMVFGPTSPVRTLAVKIASSAGFANVVFSTIICSVYLLALEQQQSNTDSETTATDKLILPLLQYVCLGIFVSEFVVNTVADGVLHFLAQPMNVLDTAVTTLSLFALGFGFLRNFAIFRMTRIIRPLKKLARNSPAVMSILTALENSSRGLCAVGLLALLFWSAVAIVGLQLYQGHLFYCSAAKYPEGMLLKAYEPDKEARFASRSRVKDQWPTRQFQYYVDGNLTIFAPDREISGVDQPRGCKLYYDAPFPQYNRAGVTVEDAIGDFHIKSSDYNYDSFPEAFRSAFLIFTFDDWSKLVLATINAKTTGAYLNHEAEASTIVPVIFYLCAGFGALLIQTLFVGVIYGTFTYMMLTRGNRKIASLKQAQWTVYESKLDCIRALQAPGFISTRYLVRELVKVFRSPKYKVAYALLVLADVLLWWVYAGSSVALAPRAAYKNDVNHSSNEDTLRVFKIFDNVFCGALLLEYLAKFLVYGCLTTISLPDEQFRFLLLIPVAIFLALDVSDSWESLSVFNEDFRDCSDADTSCNAASAQKLFYGLRTLQVFIVVPYFYELRMVVFALVSALGTTVPMVALMTIVTFAYAVIGMMFVGNETIRKRHDGGLDPNLLGESYWYVTRIKFLTITKSMNTLFVAATANNWMTVREELSDEFGSTAGRVGLWVYWFTYILLVRFLFLNVCTLIFIHKYESTSPIQPWIAMQQVDEFLQAWHNFDEFGVGKIHTKHLSRLLRLLSPPLGLSRDASHQFADRHARRVLMAMPLLLATEFELGFVQPAERWAEVKKPFSNRSRNPSKAEDAALEKQLQNSLLPKYLEFGDVLKTVHKVVMFPELQQLPDDVEIALRREFAQAKLDILRLAVNRACHNFKSNGVSSSSSSSSSASAAHGSSDSKAKKMGALTDLSMMQRLRPDVYRYRLRQILTLESHRWQKQIELTKFDEESFHECELLSKVVKDERLSAQMQLAVLDNLAVKGLLMALADRRPKLQRHVTFLTALLGRISHERAKHIHKAWMAGTVTHCGTLPVAAQPRGKNAPALPSHAKAVSGVATCASGELLVTCHGGKMVTVWKLRKETKDLAKLTKAAALKKKLLKSGRKEETKEAPRATPWATSQFVRMQTFEEDLGLVLRCAMTGDGRRFYTTCGEKIRGWCRAKKVRGSPANFYCESIMLGHSANVNCLKVFHRHLFSVSDDSTVKLWQLRARDPLQSASLSYNTTKALSLCLVNTCQPSEVDDLAGLHAVAGLEDGTVQVLPFTLKSQWLQGATWQSKMKQKIFRDQQQAPVTALAYQYRALYCGSALGGISVFKLITGCDDLPSMTGAYQDTDRAVKKQASQDVIRAQSAKLKEIVRLEHLYVLNCHSAAVTGFQLAGGLFFSVSHDMAIVSWQKPEHPQGDKTQQVSTVPRDLLTSVVKNGDGISSLMQPAGARLRHAPVTQKYGHARVVHRSPVTAVECAGEFLATCDAEGFLLLHTAQKYKEIIEPLPASALTPRAKHANGAEEEILQKPHFFHQYDIAKLTPREFIAYVMDAYYPIKIMPDKKDRIKPNQARFAATSDDDAAGDEARDQGLAPDFDDESSYSSSYSSGEERGEDEYSDDQYLDGEDGEDYGQDEALLEQGRDDDRDDDENDWDDGDEDAAGETDVASDDDDRADESGDDDQQEDYEDEDEDEGEDENRRLS